MKNYKLADISNIFKLDEDEITNFIDRKYIKKNNHFLRESSYSFLNEDLEKQFLNKFTNLSSLSISATDDELINNLNNVDYDLPTYNSYNVDSKQRKRIEGIYLRDNYIRLFRRVAMREYTSNAIDEIVNESISSFDDGDTVKLEFTPKTSIKDNSKTKTSIEAAFEKAISVLNFNKNKQSLFRDWFIDGRLPIEVVYNNADMKNGIHSCLQLDSLELYGLLIDNKEKGYIYSKQPISNTNTTKDEFLSLEKRYLDEQLILVESGIWDAEKLFQISYLKLAIKSINDVQSIENAIVKYRLRRSGQQNVWNVDVGAMAVNKAQRYLTEVKQNIGTDLQYDAESGDIYSQAVEGISNDILFPSRNGKSKTSVETINGDTDYTSKLEDLNYNLQKMYRGFKIPVGRIDSESSLDFSGNDILREELKFAAHISTLRNTFSELFIELMKRELISKGEMSIKEFNDIRNEIVIKWNESNQIVENAKIENFKKKAGAVEEIISSGIVGKFISNQFLWDNIMGMTQLDYEEQQKQIKEEMDKGEHVEPVEDEGM